jgi:hypothetical protein
VPDGKEKFDDELEALLTTDWKKGLTSEEAKARLEKFGPNGAPSPPPRAAPCPPPTAERARQRSPSTSRT